MKKRGTKKISTVDGLARLMQGEFVRVHEKFDGVDKKFEGVYTEFSHVHKQMDTEFSNVHKRMDAIESGLQDMKESSSELFGKLDEFISLYRDTKQELAVLARQFRRLEARVVQLEAKK